MRNQYQPQSLPHQNSQYAQMYERSTDNVRAYESYTEPTKKSYTKWIVLGVIVLVAAGVVGAVVGIKLAKSPGNAKAESAGSSTGSANTNSTSDSSTPSDPNDPSVFEKDPRLKRSFYGLAYTPEGSIMPDCGAKQEDVIRDIQLMSQLTGRIRLYGADCNLTELVLNAIQLTKVDMQVYLGNYINLDNDAVYLRQKANIEGAIRKFGVDHVAGVTVGNEAMLNFCVSKNSTNPNDPVTLPAAQYISSRVEDTRTSLAAMGLPKVIPVGNSDAGSYFNTQVLNSIDYGLSNVHAWFAQVTTEQAPAWTFQFFQEQNVAPAALTTRKPQMVLAEVGWPTGSKDVLHETNNAAKLPGHHASVANLQVFMDSFVCKANQDNIPYFFFEFFDEKWKDDLFGGVEGHWGLFTQQKELKAITIPDCAAP